MSNSTGPSGQVAPSAKSAAADTENDLSNFTETDTAEPAFPPKQGTSGLVLGAVGVVYGDIGTSPIYAFREAIKPVAGEMIQTAHVLGLLSLLIWTLILIVTVK